MFNKTLCALVLALGGALGQATPAKADETNFNLEAQIGYEQSSEPERVRLWDTREFMRAIRGVNNNGEPKYVPNEDDPDVLNDNPEYEDDHTRAKDFLKRRFTADWKHWVSEGETLSDAQKGYALSRLHSALGAKNYGNEGKMSSLKESVGAIGNGKIKLGVCGGAATIIARLADKWTGEGFTVTGTHETGEAHVYAGWFDGKHINLSDWGRTLKVKGTPFEAACLMAKTHDQSANRIVIDNKRGTPKIVDQTRDGQRIAEATGRYGFGYAQGLDSRISLDNFTQSLLLRYSIVASDTDFNYNLFANVAHIEGDDTGLDHAYALTFGFGALVDEMKKSIRIKGGATLFMSLLQTQDADKETNFILTTYNHLKFQKCGELFDLYGGGSFWTYINTTDRDDSDILPEVSFSLNAGVAYHLTDNISLGIRTGAIMQTLNHPVLTHKYALVADEANIGLALSTTEGLDVESGWKFDDWCQGPYMKANLPINGVTVNASAQVLEPTGFAKDIGFRRVLEGELGVAYEWFSLSANYQKTDGSTESLSVQAGVKF